MQILFLVFMFVLGAIFGSFLCCQVRRMGDRKHGRVIRAEEEDHHRRVTRLKGAPRPQLCEDGGRKRGRTRRKEYPSRSICLHCHKQLTWYDNIPIISWLALKGKCRFCHKKIGVAEIISEIATALAFLLIGTTIDVETAVPLVWFSFITAVIFTLSIIFLGIFDGLTGSLPVLGLTISAICAIITLIPSFWASLSVMPFLAALLYGGIYLLLYLVSRGKWVGDGDWILAAAIGLALGHPWLAAVALFVANFSACLIMLPFVKQQKNHQIYFGPFLVLSFVIVYTFSDFFLSMI